jgi:hypothetical protein
MNKLAIRTDLKREHELKMISNTGKELAMSAKPRVRRFDLKNDN